MFHYDGAEEVVPSFSGYGLGGLKGLKGLPDRICNRVNRHISNVIQSNLIVLISVS